MDAHTPNVELVYFTGCPNVETARANLKTALSTKGLPLEWLEWNQLDSEAPTRVKGLSSPTVLVHGQDVSNSQPAIAMACRADGAPSVDEILDALGTTPPAA